MTPDVSQGGSYVVTGDATISQWKSEPGGDEGET